MTRLRLVSVVLAAAGTTLPAIAQEAAKVSTTRLRDFHRAITQSPRLAGSDECLRAGDYVAARFLEAGLEIETREYKVWVSRPVGKPSLKLLADKPIELDLFEHGFEWDRDSYNGKLVPPHLAYTKSAELTALVVYANYGLPDDYEQLRKLGVDVRGRIVLARYGKCFRGVKVDLAEQHGAAAILLYSDPADDGYVKGDVYPRGTMRNETGVQRGSPLYIYRYPGDPLTPGQPAVDGVKRIRREAAKSLPKIPGLPIPYKAAAPILKSMAGPRVPDAWQGGLPFAYHTGPGPARLEFKVFNKEETVTIRDVFGVLPGKSGKDGDFVLFGNHRDSWVNGAIDPAGGTACMLEVATVLGARAKAGWKPDYTIRFASWDGEEYGIIGSTEYGEEHEAMLRDKLVCYINADSPISGPNFGSSATPELRGLVQQLADQVLHPDTGEPLSGGRPVHPGTMGGGSDFMFFINRLGTPCIAFSLSGRTGVYHSAFDTHWFMSQRVDPGFRYHAALSKLLIKCVETVADRNNRAYDPKPMCTDVADALERLLPAGQFAKQRSAIGETLARIEKLAEKKRESSPRALSRLGQAWIDETGLFGRTWYHNLLVAPGRRTGYAASILPGVADAIEDGDLERCGRELDRVLERLREYERRLGALK